MKNKMNLSFNISVFEPVSENSESKLIGGFSQTHSSSRGFDYLVANNCWGGNCQAGCGDFPKNVSCNNVAGCGVIKE